MKWFFSGLIAAHGLVHLIGFARGYGLGNSSRLAQPVTRSMGFAWLAAAAMMLGTAVMLAAGHTSWWLAGSGALFLSQWAVISAWSEAKFGTLPNLVILACVVYGFASLGPLSFSAEYREEVCARLMVPVSPPVVTEEDLARLPEPVRCYVRLSGAVGQPGVHHFRAVWRGRIRQLAGDPWMEFTAEQVNFIEEGTRFFLMDARKGLLPVDVYHAFDEDGASMRVRLLSLVPLIDIRGPEADRAETVTIFNEMCLLAPDSLIHPDVRFEPVDDHTVRAWYTRDEHTVSARLTFNDRCELVNFTSGDRFAAVGDGGGFVKMPFSTPVGEYRDFGPRRIMARGEARWHPPEGTFTYLELELVEYEVNGPAGP